jgi:tetratricopeptide (TPR) repeat protein
VKKWQEWRDTLVRAADAAVAYSRGMTVDDDAGYGEALWRGIELYDRAGALAQAIGALELFIAERPTDPLAPDALLRLGKAYHAAGQFDRAIDAFKRNQFRYERTLAAQKSGVPLAKAYIAKGPASYARAEDALQATLQSPLLTPEADEFRQALLELAELYYRTSRFEEAVAKLEEVTSRYPKDDRTGQLLFLMADSYRKSAALLLVAATRPTTAPTDPAVVALEEAARAERTAARRERLAKARQLYDSSLDHFKLSPPKAELDQLYFKLAHFYRADCVYDIGEFDEAIRLYDAAALRFQDDPSALTAYVQIVNAHNALGRPSDARKATERARWLLQRMPAAAFKEAQRSMPQAAWENWVKWTKSIDATAGAKDP